MVAPCYFELGKKTRSCLISAYNTGLWRLDCVTATQNGCKFITFGTSEHETKNVEGSTEFRMTFYDNFTLSEKWHTTKTVSTEIMMANKFLEGLKLGFHGDYHMDEGPKVQLKFGYANDYFKCDTKIPTINQAMFYGYALIANSQWALAYRTELDVKEREFQVHGLCLNYANDKTEVCLKSINLDNLRCSIFQTITPTIDVAAKVSYVSEDLLLTVGGQYKLQKYTLLKAKCTNKGEISLAFVKQLRQNIQCSYFLSVDGKNLTGNGHKMGVGWNFQP